MNLEELLNDVGFAAQLEAVKDDPEAMAKLFNEKGIEVTAEELRQAMEMMEKEELSEAELEDVAGGISVLRLKLLDQQRLDWRRPGPPPFVSDVPGLNRFSPPISGMKKSKKS